MLCPCHINTSLRCLLHHSVSSMSMLAARDVSYVRCHADSSNGTVEQLLTSYSHWTESLLWRQENPVWIYLEFTCENTLSSPTETHWGQSVVPDCFLTDNQLRWLQMMPTRHGSKTHIEQLSNISHSGQRVASFFLPHMNPPAWRNMRKTVSQERMVNCYPQTGQLGKTRWWRPDIMLEKL